jgi:hypothetical protein
MTPCKLWPYCRIEYHRAAFAAIKANRANHPPANKLKPSAADDDMEKIFEERQRRAILEIERLSAERCEYGGGKPPKPN